MDATHELGASFLKFIVVIDEIVFSRKDGGRETPMPEF
jgi:hypothetical protein